MSAAITETAPGPAWTEGPWRLDDENPRGGAYAVVGDRQQLIALVYGRTRQEQDANARLLVKGADLAAFTIDPAWDELVAVLESFSSGGTGPLVALGKIGKTLLPLAHKRTVLAIGLRGGQ